MLKMLSDTRSSDNTKFETSRETRSSSDLKSSARQNNSRTVKEKVIATRAKQSLKHQDKAKVKIRVSQPYGDLSHKLRQRANDGISAQPKTLEMENHMQQFVKVMRKKDEELIKYMSNLPGYLERMERGENIQGKALNVGVLDWRRLENWKGNQTCIGAGDSSNAFLTKSNLLGKVPMNAPTSSNAVHNESPACKSGHRPSLSSSLGSSHNNCIPSDVKRPINNVVRFQDFETASKSSADGQKSGRWTYKSFGRNNLGAALEEEKKKDSDRKTASKVGNWSANSRYDGILMRPKENGGACIGEANLRVEKKQESDIKRTTSEREISQRMGASSSKMRSHYISPISNELKNKKVLEELQESAIDLSPQHQPAEDKNIIFFLPKKFSQNSFREAPRRSLDKNLTKVDSNSSSGSFHHEEKHSSELFYEIPHSCPLPVGAEANAHTATNITSDASDTSACLYMKMQVNALAASECSQSSVGVSEDAVETSKLLDRQTAKLAAGKSRHPFPNHRFSFSFSRLTRSFSYKDSSAHPQVRSTYASVKSGPVISRASSCLDDSNKASGHNRYRSSPFRRILGPLPKFKGSNPLHSSESDQPLKGSLNSLSFEPADSIESLQNEKHETSRMRALLQLTVKDGLPLFRLVVDNNSSILAAPMKNLPTCKNDSEYNYTFYTIDEIKKKSGGWVNQGSKEKKYGCVYNVLGQMQVSCSSSVDLTGQNSISQCKVKEAVLFGVDLKQGDQSSPKFMQNGELAAIVVKTSNGNLTVDTQQNFEDVVLTKKGHSHVVPANELSHSVIAILPGGIHGLPSEGVPSPLIQRWKFGGSCDCGGWDVGCKLCVLSDESQSCKIPRTSNSCQTSDRFQLCIQGEAPQGKPTFSLEPLEKGAFAVEFRSAISPLQAFFICVTVLSCQKSSDLTAWNQAGEKVFQEARDSIDGTKKRCTIFQGEAPVKYTPSPPLSPVGRV